MLSGFTLRVSAIEKERGMGHRERRGETIFIIGFSEGRISGKGSDFSLHFPMLLARSVTVLRTLNCYWTVSGTFGAGVHKKM